MHRKQQTSSPLLLFKHLKIEAPQKFHDQSDRLLLLLASIDSIFFETLVLYKIFIALFFPQTFVKQTRHASVKKCRTVSWIVRFPFKITLRWSYMQDLSTIETSSELWIILKSSACVNCCDKLLNVEERNSREWHALSASTCEWMSTLSHCSRKHPSFLSIRYGSTFDKR